jgi:hypothetical protein
MNEEQRHDAISSWNRNQLRVEVSKIRAQGNVNESFHTNHLPLGSEGRPITIGDSGGSLFSPRKKIDSDGHYEVSINGLRFSTADPERLLTPGHWMNDNIITLELNKIMEKLNEEERAAVLLLDTQVFSQFKALSATKDMVNLQRVQTAVKKNMAKKGNLGLVIIPLHLSKSHWAMAAIHCPVDRELRIGYFDSVAHTYQHTMGILQECCYLCGFPTANTATGNQARPTFMGDVRVPQQEDTYRCGDFLITFVDNCIRDYIKKQGGFPTANTAHRDDWLPDSEFRGIIAASLAKQIVSQCSELKRHPGIAKFFPLEDPKGGKSMEMDSETRNPEDVDMTDGIHEGTTPMEEMDDDEEDEAEEEFVVEQLPSDGDEVDDEDEDEENEKATSAQEEDEMEVNESEANASQEDKEMNDDNLD